MNMLIYLHDKSTADRLANKIMSDQQKAKNKIR
jgi:hypothetical protein